MSLARLLEQATPGPWGRTLVPPFRQSPGERVYMDQSDVALIALAPDMAQLLIDMADALRPKGGHRIDCRAYRSYAACSCGYERNRELLTRFAVLDGHVLIGRAK